MRIIPRFVAAGAAALALALGAGLTPTTASASTIIAPMAAPVVSRLADVNVNYGQSTRATVNATGATSYEWQVWVANRGWYTLAKGGTGYKTITIYGWKQIHMSALRVKVNNSTGSTYTNMARVRVWGISAAYPAARNTWVYVNNWAVAMSSPYQMSGSVYHAWAYAYRDGSIAAKPFNAIDISYVDRASYLRYVSPDSCRLDIPSLYDIPPLGYAKQGRGGVCINTSGWYAPGGVWRLRVGYTSWYGSESVYLYVKGF